LTLKEKSPCGDKSFCFAESGDHGDKKRVTKHFGSLNFLVKTLVLYFHRYAFWTPGNSTKYLTVLVLLDVDSTVNPKPKTTFRYIAGGRFCKQKLCQLMAFFVTI